jgi:L,D-transpeptidase YcbB
VRIALIFAALATAVAQTAPMRATTPAPASAYLHQLVDSGTLTGLRWPKFSRCQADVRRFYEATGYRVAWLRDDAPTTQALALIGTLQHAGAQGLLPEDYDASRWTSRVAHLRPALPHPAPEDEARFDLALTISALRYASDLHAGKVNPQDVCLGLDAAKKKCDLAGVLSQSVIHGDDIQRVFEGLEPPFEGYRRTKEALKIYERLAAEDDGELLPATRKPADPGDPYRGAQRLERLLRLVGDLPRDAAVPAGSQIYQEPLVTALKHFQTRHGLEADGRIGKATLKQLNVPLSYRVRQLELVLERWRWVPESFARPPIVVNIPEFRLYAFNDRYQPALQMKVVVGGAYRRQTPVFANQMTHVIFRPYWNVPLSIQRNELVPKIAKDAAYLGENDYEIVTHRGEVVAGRPVTASLLAQLRSGQLEIRQIPGPKNALGYVKFMFPNEYNVYLHGTPAKALFAKTRRDFSHGCIRVEKPEELALWVLQDKPGWDLDHIREAENGAKPLQVNLAHPIPVLILYATAVVRSTGEVDFFDDIYGHDARLDKLLGSGYPYSESAATSAGCDRRRRE